MAVAYNAIMNDFEYIVVAPLEFVFRKIGKIVTYVLLACTFYFLFSFGRGLFTQDFSGYETRMFLAYAIVSILTAGIINIIRTWLSGRRLELSREMDLNFHYKFIENDYEPEVMQRSFSDNSTPNFNSTFTVNDTQSNQNKNQNKQNNNQNAQTQATVNPNLTVREGFENSDKLLEDLIGLTSVKEEVLKLKLKLELEQKQKLQGRTSKSKYNMHMFFTGNPGTGKTTVARIITGILYEMGYISQNKCVEVGKQDIVGQYLGQSAQKANDAIKSALGGVLFIDEAYSLCENYQGDGFAKESVEVILKAMEDYRDNLIIIFAGYTKEMKKFKEMNPGLKSRIGLTIEFPDYNCDELTEIFIKKAKDNDYKVPEESIRKIHTLCDIASREKDFGNGRFVENLFREIEINHALTTRYCDAYDEKIMTILPEDIQLEILDKILA